MKELQQAEPELEIRWRAFELRPEPVPTLDPQGEYLSRAWQDRVYPLARKMGIPLKQPPVQPRSRLAHQAAYWARSQGHFDEYNAAIFRALFERGEDIGDGTVLLRLAADTGLNPHNLDASLLCGEFLEAVLTDERDAGRMGIRGVPSFLASPREIVSGVQPLSGLKELIKRARS